MQRLFELSFTETDHIGSFVKFYLDDSVLLMEIIIGRTEVLENVSLSSINAILESIHPDNIHENNAVIHYNNDVFEWHLKRTRAKDHIYFDINAIHETVIVHVSIVNELTKRLEAIKSLL